LTKNRLTLCLDKSCKIFSRARSKRKKDSSRRKFYKRLSRSELKRSNLGERKMRSLRNSKRNKRKNKRKLKNKIKLIK